VSFSYVFSIERKKVAQNEKAIHNVSLVTLFFHIISHKKIFLKLHGENIHKFNMVRFVVAVPLSK